MPTQLTAEDARQSLNSHIAAKGIEIREKYGPAIGWNELVRLLEDRTCVRYPCEVVFDSQPLNPGEMAHPAPRGQDPRQGFTIYVHPFFRTQLETVAWVVLYQLVLVNYGPFATPADAEMLGASALGISTDQYYESLCRMADALAANSRV